MYTPQVDASSVFHGNFSIIPPFVFDLKPRFSLDTSGVLGLLGGDDAVSAMAAVHVYGNSRWLGWYNVPGSLQISSRLRAFAKSAPSRGTSPSSPKSSPRSVDTDPTALFDLDARKGPKFRAAHSGTIIDETGYLAHLFMKECAAWNGEGKSVPGRKTQPIGITIADLGQAPASEMRPAYSSVSTLLFACIPIVTSVGTSVVCALSGDWYASLLILVGIIANGVSSHVLGAADFVFTHPEPAKGSPAGDGILGTDKEFVLLRGTEGAVNSVTRGRFSLRFASEEHYSVVRCCGILFLVQCVIQLLLVPQASLFGQIMFLASFGVSALYNAALSSQSKERIHRKLLCERVLECPPLTKYTLGTRTTAVVFMLLVLHPQDPTRLLNELLPNDTKVWRRWKETILDRLHHGPDDPTFIPDSRAANVDGFTQEEKELLALLYGDAQAAFRGYRDYLRIDAL